MVVVAAAAVVTVAVVELGAGFAAIALVAAVGLQTRPRLPAKPAKIFASSAEADCLMRPPF